MTVFHRKFCCFGGDLKKKMDRNSPYPFMEIIENGYACLMKLCKSAEN